MLQTDLKTVFGSYPVHSYRLVLNPKAFSVLGQ